MTKFANKRAIEKIASNFCLQSSDKLQNETLDKRVNHATNSVYKTRKVSRSSHESQDAACKATNRIVFLFHSEKRDELHTELLRLLSPALSETVQSNSQSKDPLFLETQPYPLASQYSTDTSRLNRLKLQQQFPSNYSLTRFKNSLLKQIILKTMPSALPARAREQSVIVAFANKQKFVPRCVANRRFAQKVCTEVAQQLACKSSRIETDSSKRGKLEKTNRNVSQLDAIAQANIVALRVRHFSDTSNLSAISLQHSTNQLLEKLCASSLMPSHDSEKLSRNNLLPCNAQDLATPSLLGKQSNFLIGGVLLQQQAILKETPVFLDVQRLKQLETIIRNKQDSSCFPLFFSQLLSYLSRTLLVSSQIRGIAGNQRGLLEILQARQYKLAKSSAC